MKKAFPFLLFLIIAGLLPMGCRRDAPHTVNCNKAPSEPPTAASPTAEAPVEEPVPPSPWQEQTYTLNGVQRAVSVQFPQNYTPLRAYPLLLFYPGTAPEELRTRIALLVDAQTKPAAAPGWPSRAAAENALPYLDNNLQTLARRRFLVVPLKEDAMDFACAQAWRFDGLIVKCNDNAPLPRLEATLLGNLAPLPVFIDNSANPDPPDTAQELAQMLRQAGVTHISAPEYLLNAKSAEEILSEAVAFLVAHTPEQPEAAFNWSALWLRHGRVHWLRMEAFADCARPAEAHAEILCEGSHGRPVHLKVDTGNLTALAVRRDFPGLRANAPLILTLDGKDILVGKEASAEDAAWCHFRREGTDGAWARVRHQPADSRKSAACEGPIAAFLAQPFVIVTPTGDEPQADAWRRAAAAFAQDFGARYGYAPPVLTDKEFRPAEADGRNLLLFGTPENNLLSATLLEGNAAFLPALYNTLPETYRRTDDGLCCMVLQPASLLAPLLQPERFDDCDYVLWGGGSTDFWQRGVLNAEWNLPVP